MKKVLVCPLDWGLGHATRCIPVIQAFQRQGCEVLIASSGDALQLLRFEFPSLTYFPLPSYRPSYSRGNMMAWKIFIQLPKFARATHDEHELVEGIVRSNNIDLVVSDNRYGCWSLSTKSVFITHQSKLRMPAGFGWAGPIVNFLLQRYIRRYDEVWVPDEPDSGLTRPFLSVNFPKQKFIGWLSRFEQRNATVENYDVIALVSGPEPQRSIFEKMVTDQLIASGRKSLIVAGEPGKAYRKQMGNLQIVNHLSASELEDAILSSGVVVSRSGYSTVMDLIALGKRAIFVPTPQQPEQIQLGKFLHDQQIALCVDQKDFNLEAAVERRDAFSGLSAYKKGAGHLEEAVQAVLA
jgi:uncharacterized protein (TIGR00661 family)